MCCDFKLRVVLNHLKESFGYLEDSSHLSLRRLVDAVKEMKGLTFDLQQAGAPSARLTRVSALHSQGQLCFH